MRFVAAGAPEELQASLARIPRRRPDRELASTEQCAFDRLAQLANDRTSETFDGALRIWDEAMGLSWPKRLAIPGPAHRASCGDDRNRPWPTTGAMARAMRKTSERLEAQRREIPHVRTIVAERTRVESTTVAA